MSTTGPKTVLRALNTSSPLTQIKQDLWVKIINKNWKVRKLSETAKL